MPNPQTPQPSEASVRRAIAHYYGEARVESMFDAFQQMRLSDLTVDRITDAAKFAESIDTAWQAKLAEAVAETREQCAKAIDNICSCDACKHIGTGAQFTVGPDFNGEYTGRCPNCLADDSMITELDALTDYLRTRICSLNQQTT